MSSERERSLLWVSAITPGKMGSFERLCIRMAQRARTLGVRMRLAFLGEPTVAVAQELERFGASWMAVPGLVDLNAAASRRLLRLCDSAGPMLCHFHYCTGASPLYARLSAAGCLSVFTYHMSGSAVAARGLKKAVKRLRRAATTSFLDACTTVSSWSGSKLAADYLVPESRIVVIYNGVEIPPAIPAVVESASPGRLLVVAALIHDKGVDTAIRALARVRESCPGAMLSIVGTGPERGRLEQLAAAEGVAEAVDFLGVRDDVAALMASHDVVLVPSRWGEAFGLAIAEGMAAARPVLASRVGGIQELISDGVDGLLLPSDDVPGWAQAVARVLADRELARALGTAAYGTAASRFDIRRSVSDYWDLYRSLDPWAFSDSEGIQYAG